MPDGMEERRRELVEGLRRRGVLTDPRVAKAMMTVERHLFVPDTLEGEAYQDTPLHIGLGQTISAPHMVAIMLEALLLEEGHRVLEVGTGSGYNAALLAELVGERGMVYTIERLASLAEEARERMARAGYHNVEVVVGDGSKGLPDEAPFDRIIVTAAGPAVPETLRSQLADGGVMLMPVGTLGYQDLVRVRREGDDFEVERLGGVMFVPLIGDFGHRE